MENLPINVDNAIRVVLNRIDAHNRMEIAKRRLRELQQQAAEVQQLYEAARRDYVTNKNTEDVFKASLSPSAWKIILQRAGDKTQQSIFQ